MPNSGPKGPLDGLTVADFSRVLAGPLATMMLGDLGADVIKIERPGTGDDTRAWGPPFTAEGTSAYYLSVNRNKRSVTLDLRESGELAHAREIAIGADVIIENFRAETMEGFGLGFDELSEENPGLIYCRISGFGSGEGRDLPGYDFIAQALSGLMSITGNSGGAPMKTGVAIVDVLTGLNATIGILAALHERDASGVGQRVEVNLFSSALAGLVNQASSYLTTGIVPHRLGNLHPSIAPYETLATATMPIAVAVGNDRQFEALCEALEAPKLALDERWVSNADRVQNRAELAEKLEALLRARDCATWIERLQDRGVPCGAVNGIDDAFSLAEQLGIEATCTIPTKDGEPARSVANPIVFSRTPATYRHPPPELGADTQSFLDESFGR